MEGTLTVNRETVEETSYFHAVLWRDDNVMVLTVTTLSSGLGVGIKGEGSEESNRPSLSVSLFVGSVVIESSPHTHPVVS